MSFLRRLFGRREPDSAPAEPPIDFPFPLQQVRGADAPAVLEQLRREGAAGGFTPVLLGRREDVELLLEQLEAGAEQSVEEILAAAEAVDPAAWLREQAEDDPEQFHAEAGEWPAEPSPSGLMVHMDFRGRPHAAVYIARFPTPRSWEVFAHLKFGGWNECPSPEVHVALARDWHRRYGADLAALTFDVAQFAVARPPRDADEARALAREQFLYCSDIVHQGVQTMEALAATLHRAPWWFFWWD